MKGTNPLLQFIYSHASSQCEFAKKVGVTNNTITSHLKEDFTTDRGKLILVKYALKLKANLEIDNVSVKFN